jgi:AmmeMemoRadiSam system protein A
MLVYAGFVPHPPLLIEGIGDDLKSEVMATHQAYQELAGRVATIGPRTAVLVTSHGPIFSDAFTMASWSPLKGDFTAFGATVSMSFENDINFVTRAEDLALRMDVPLLSINPRQLATHRQNGDLDHGTMVPLYYLAQAGWQGKVVCVRIGGLPPWQCYLAGKILALAAGESTALLASGDLSHCLSGDAPSPFNPAGVEFDQLVVSALKEDNFRAILDLPPEFRQRAAECGWRPLVTLLGALDGYRVTPEILSYEGPFGVGYLVAELKPGADDSARQLQPGPSTPRDESAQVKLARRAIHHFLATGEILTSQEDLGQRAGVFVSLKEDDQLRGCIGTIQPAQETLAEEIMRNAIDAATQDPRFEPVTLAELDTLTISVDILGEPVPASFEELDPSQKGLVVEWQNRKGLLLPDLPGVDTPQEQLDITLQKAGIPKARAQEAKLFTFLVTRFH